MNVRFAISLFFLCHALATGTALAQAKLAPSTVPSLKSSDNVDNIDITGKKQLREGGRKRYGVVKFTGVPMYAEPSLSAEIVDEVAKFGTTLKLFEETADGFFLAQYDDRREFGWVESEDILVNHEAKRASKTDPNFVKVVVRNDWRSPGTGGPEHMKVETKAGAGRDFPTLFDLNLFEVRYLYDIKTDSTTKETFYLIGSQPGFDPREPEAALKGWIPRDAATLWTNRVAVYYDPNTRIQRETRSEPVKIFRDEASVKAYIASDGSKDSGAISEEAFSVRTGNGDLPPDRSRFPVLWEGNIGGRGQDYIKIAYVGDIIGNDGATPVTTATEKEIEDTRYLMSEVTHRDILFLIDATTSMGAYFQAAAEAVRMFVEQQSGDEESSKYRYALGIYRDYADGREKEYRALSGFTSDARRIMRLMDPGLAHSTQDDKDFPEAVYQGMTLALKDEDLDWRDQRSNAIVVIGDHGNHPNDVKFPLSRVVEAANNRQAAVYAINIHARKDTEQFNRLFVQQMRQLVSQLSERGDVFEVPPGGAPARVTQQVLSSLEKFRLFSRRTRQAIVEHTEQGASVEDLERTYGTVVTSNALEFLRRAGLSSKVKLHELRQVVLEGWVAKNLLGDRQLRQLKPWVLISRYEVSELQGFIAHLLQGLTRGDSKSVGDVVVSSVERFSGDESGSRFSNENDVGEFLTRRFHLPFKEANSLLNKTPAQIQDLYNGDPRWARDFRDHLEKKLQQLLLMLHGFEAEEFKWDEGQQQFVPINSTKRKWFWQANRESYAWMPIEYIP
jgi:type VI secretion system TssR-like protein